MLTIYETKNFVYFVKAVEMYNGFAVNFMCYSTAVDITIRVMVNWYVRGMEVNFYAYFYVICFE